MYFVAELGASHQNSLEVAQALVDAAYHAGADAIKLQVWSQGEMVAQDMVIPSGPWAGKRLSSLYALAHLPWDWVPILAEQATKLGMDWFSSVFDIAALEYLERIGCPQYKIASFEITDLELLTAVAATGKPVMISTGVATDAEIERAMKILPRATLLHCVSEYPAPEEKYCLGRMAYLRERFKTEVGLSDHTTTDLVPVLAVALGATVLERHITLDQYGGGLDDCFASVPDVFGMVVGRVRKAQVAMKDGGEWSGAGKLDLKRSAWLVRPLAAGEILTRDHIKVARPGGSLGPHLLEMVLGCPANRDIPEGEVKLDYFDLRRATAL